jgi:Domain of unknown function (DUF305)
MRRKLSAAGATLLCFGALAAGCSSAASGMRTAPGGGARGATTTRPPAGAAASTASSSRPKSAGFNSADVRYARQMVADDEQVLAMAKLPQFKSSGGVVPTLAYAVLEELPSHIVQYRKWLAMWKEPIPAALGTGHLGTVNGKQFAGHSWRSSWPTRRACWRQQRGRPARAASGRRGKTPRMPSPSPRAP